MMRLVFAAAILMAMNTAASAHAMLEHAVPGAGTIVNAAPHVVSLDFSESLEPALSTISVSDAKGHDMTAAPSVAEGMTMRVALKPIGAGTYRVKWVALSVDTHRTEGAFTFAVKP